MSKEKNKKKKNDNSSKDVTQLVVDITFEDLRNDIENELIKIENNIDKIISSDDSHKKT